MASRWLISRVFDNTDPRSLAFRLRARRIRPLLDMLGQLHNAHGQVRMLDIGGTRGYWSILSRARLESLGVRITLVNLEQPATSRDDSLFTHIEADACDLSAFDDDAFHIAHSNSVLEHVGSRERMRQFAAELRRVAPRHFVQTPNFWFPVEPHAMLPFIHWLPLGVRVALVRRFTLGHWPRQETAEDAVRLLRDNDLLTRREFAGLFPDSEIRVERVWGLPKSLLAIR